MATPVTLLPLGIAPHLRLLPSAGHYPASLVLQASPPPCRPNLTLTGCRLARATPPDRASRVASTLLFHACCRQYPGGTRRCVRRSLPDGYQPSPLSGRVGFRITRFEAYTAFTGVAARMVAKPPLAARCAGVLQTMSLPPSSAPTATGWSDSCRAGFAPAEEWHLSTAHRIRDAMSTFEPNKKAAPDCPGRPQFLFAKGRLSQEAPRSV